MIDIEEWRDVLGYEGLYEVSSFGVVRSKDRVTSTYSKKFKKVVKRSIKGVVLSTHVHSSGYRTVHLSIGASGSTKRVASLVCEAFHGPRKSGDVVRHKDGVKLNNSRNNLEWGTCKENTHDMRRHGTYLYGIKVSTSKIDDEMVDFIKKSGSYGSVKHLIPIGKTQFYRIKRGLSWAHCS